MTENNQTQPPKTQEQERSYEFPELLEELQKLYEEGLASASFQEGKIVSGKVSKVHGGVVTIDLAEEKQGQIMLPEFGGYLPKEGEEVSAIVEIHREGPWILSKQKYDDMARYDRVMEACRKDELIEGTVVARVKGGLSVDIGLRAFLPGSHVADKFIEDLDQFVGQKYKFKVIKLDPKRGSIMLSRRAQSSEESAAQKRALFSDLKEGDIREGVVRRLQDFGAFVDIGGADGLLHVSDMSWGRVRHPSDVLQVGDEIQVKVLRFTPETGKMSLGLKQLKEDPWSQAEARFAQGTKVKGKIVSMPDFGAFVELAPGVEGLLHISDITWDRRLRSPSQVLQMGAEIEVLVLNLDLANRKLRLGVKQLTANPWSEFLTKNPIGSVLKGTVRGLTEFGAFVNLAEHIDGLLHVSEFSWTVRFRSPNELLRKGDEVEVVLTRADPEKERLSLSIKQRHPDPWEQIVQKYPVGRMVPVTVRRILKAGLLVSVEPGIEGFVPWKEIPEPGAEAMKGKRPPQDPAASVEKPATAPEEGEERPEARNARDEAKARLFHEGASLTVEVIHVNPSDHKFRLSAKDVTTSEEAQNYVEYIAQNTAEQKEATPKLGEILKEALEKTAEPIEATPAASIEAPNTQEATPAEPAEAKTEPAEERPANAPEATPTEAKPSEPAEAKTESAQEVRPAEAIEAKPTEPVETKPSEPAEATPPESKSPEPVES